MLKHESSNIEDLENDDKRFKRTYVACLNCRVRKVKCDLGPASSPRDRCVRCERERRDCVFVDLKKRKLAKVRTGNLENHGNLGEILLPSPVGPGQPQVPIPTTNQHQTEQGKETENGPKHFSTMEGALVFLANAAGKIATADERDNIDAREKHSQLEGINGKTPGNVTSLGSSQGPEANVYVGEGKGGAGGSSDSGAQSYKHMHFPTTTANPENLRGASPGIGPDSRSSVASSTAATPTPTPIPTSTSTSTDQPPAYLRPHILSYTTHRPLENRLMMPPAENSYLARPEGSSVLVDIEYIGPQGILTAPEAEYLIDMFFLTMHPFFPHIPRFLHLPRALSGYPILLCAILTISSRYHLLETQHHAAIAKNIEIHDRLWLYVQRLISQTVWAEASTRSIGTVFAFLLFTEWNPRAIHWRWSDYANRAEDAAENKDPHDTLSGTVEPAGLGAMRRSYRMAWMLIGSAVRLAQDTGFMELSAKTFLATHVAEINSVMNMKRRSMLSQSLAELDLDTQEISEAEMETREGNEVKVLGLSEDMSFPENNLQFTEAQKAQIELLQITSVGHESLYGYKAQLGSLSQRQNLSILNFMNPMINSWSRKYKNFLVPSKSKLARKVNTDFRTSDPKVAQGLASGIENESFIFEFNYTKLYIYSLALSPSPKTKDDSKPGKVTLKLDEISKSAKYIEQAFNAAREMLQVAHRVHKLKMLRFMPVRWVTRIVRAVAFMVKCYLTITAHKTSELSADPSSNMDHFDATILSLSLISVEEIVQSIQKAAITLRDCSPDELHLCTRYSNVLLYLYSEMKATLKNYSASAEDVEDTGSKEPFPHQQQQQQQQHQQQHQQQQQQQQQQQHPAAEVQIPDPVDPTSEKPNFNENFREFDNGLSGDSEVIDWFINNRNVGLDFVGPWTELIEQHIEENNLNMDNQLNFG